jgi:hypothetical protein
MRANHAKGAAMSDRMREMQERNIQQVMTLGVAGVISAPLFGFFVPFGFIIGPIAGALGIVMIVQSVRLKASLKAK